MYYIAQILKFVLLWTIGVNLCLTLNTTTTTTRSTIAAESNETQMYCPSECICLSSKQVMCNTGGLNKIPTNLSYEIEDLSLSKNNITVISSDAFKNYVNLRQLTLINNPINNIKAFAFRGLSNLKELSIQYTPLRCISSYSFATLQNLTMIILANNRITVLESNIFAGSSNIKVIILSNNPLMKIESKAFSGLDSVGSLILPSSIKLIEADAFNGLSNVGLLKISYADFGGGGLLGYTFNGIMNVRTLTIQDCDLGIIKLNAFSGIKNIENLNILNNKIDEIKQLNFTNDNAINMFRFHGNHILKSPKAKDILLKVRNIWVKDNYFPCDCQIHDLYQSDFINGSINEFSKNNYCISPIEYNGKTIDTIDIDYIAKCHDKLVQSNFGSSSTPVINIFNHLSHFVTIIFLSICHINL